ncbi:MAG: hypothetical protein GY788_22960 [bacterium]|nr:hypothetical protein [bacterium]
MTLEEIRSLSGFLFGAADRLAVAAAIGRIQGKPITVKAVAEESGLNYNRAQEQVSWFKRADLLRPDFDPGSRSKEYRPVDICYWSAAARLMAELEEMPHWA